ncbi:oligosaccharide biosynthesis protein Alg14 like protein [Rhizodiscina lignyota]|uniref:UDP-N-acetylglucosamine transferase subunit ALG14 n=1 Tax=Rhizodiscina lignyota TaxID=1504668 RepID=A0A9P4MAQ5_9PEZI|nr:oligosaccharide biosynthesis protein Alg14 like protein [Rhizodiscina lignyota]
MGLLKLLVHPLVLSTLAFLMIAIILAGLRVLTLIPPRRGPPRERARDEPGRILIVLGSGGHTAEMLAMINKVTDILNVSIDHRTYVVSSGDAFSANKAKKFELDMAVRAELEKREKEMVEALREAMEENGTPLVPAQVLRKREARSAVSTQKHSNADFTSSYSIATLPRARHVHQSIFTAPFTAMYCLIATLRLLAERPYPDIILTNGPGTAVIVVLASILLRFFNFRGANDRSKMRTVYVESFARVNTLSLSGRLLLLLVDRFLVQWKQLEGCGGGKGEYKGVLV